MNEKTADSQTTAAAVPPGRKRRLGLFALGAVVLLGALGYSLYWFLDGRYYESTDDAYVNGDVVQVTSEVPGTVLALNVDDTQLVVAGQPLLQLDPADAKIAEENAEADLARAVRRCAAVRAGRGAARANRPARASASAPRMMICSGAAA
jgi:membrane fusion protein (multidrug efflux system)